MPRRCHRCDTVFKELENKMLVCPQCDFTIQRDVFDGIWEAYLDGRHDGYFDGILLTNISFLVDYLQKKTVDNFLAAVESETKPQ